MKKYVKANTDSDEIFQAISALLEASNTLVDAIMALGYDIDDIREGIDYMSETEGIDAKADFLSDINWITKQLADLGEDIHNKEDFYKIR